MAGRLGLTLAEYRALETGGLQITNDLYELIAERCGWPRGSPPRVTRQPAALRRIYQRRCTASRSMGPPDWTRRGRIVRATVTPDRYGARAS
jgi:hypothetical protein